MKYLILTCWKIVRFGGKDDMPQIIILAKFRSRGCVRRAKDVNFISSYCTIHNTIQTGK